MNDIQLKDVLHYYLGCEIYCHGGHYKGEVAIIEGVDIRHGITTANVVKSDFNIIGWDFFTKYWKLKCRSLDSMTEEEKTYVGFSSMIKDEIIWTPEKLRYLLSKGFDLFGLIERNLAINKNANP